MPVVRKAVIPAAGLGTRVLPASKAMPKEMLPIVDKPAIQYIVEEAVAAGITDILIITNRGKEIIEDHFDHNIELEQRLEASGREQVLEDMTAPLQNVTTGYVTTAIRDARLCGVEIREGDWMGLEKDTVYASTDCPVKAAMALFAGLPAMEDKQVVTAFAGKGVPAEEIAALEEAFSEAYPLIEIGFIEGGQDVYRYIFAIE